MIGCLRWAIIPIFIKKGSIFKTGIRSCRYRHAKRR
jgi:hypothetical protein